MPKNGVSLDLSWMFQFVFVNMGILTCTKRWTSEALEQMDDFGNMFPKKHHESTCPININIYTYIIYILMQSMINKITIKMIYRRSDRPRTHSHLHRVRRNSWEHLGQRNVERKQWNVEPWGYTGPVITGHITNHNHIGCSLFVIILILSYGYNH